MLQMVQRAGLHQSEELAPEIADLLICSVTPRKPTDPSAQGLRAQAEAHRPQGDDHEAIERTPADLHWSPPLLSQPDFSLS